MTGLRGRPVLVTGAASGIGEATAARLAAEGAAVALVDRNAALLESVAARLRQEGARAQAFVADVSREEDVRDVVDAAVAAFGGLRGLVTSAGIFDPGDMQDLEGVSVGTFDRTLAVNLRGTFVALKHALKHLARDGGAVVTIASTAGLRGHGFGSGYTASKGGVIALTRLVAHQYGDRRVRANCVCPGATDTPMTGGVFRLPDRVAALERSVPLRRCAEPHEIGDVACFLLSEDASYLNGQVIAVDGGALVR
jgi:NAD(P)-dependent dehydrogenase (short-subunit alcohol dehydrogenase family)